MEDQEAETPVIPPNQETENMEVHHHAHAHGKKNWTSYLWEFMMLFLAVFCGFLAEYQLEHTIEHQREKQYIESLVADLKSDQEILSGHISSVQSGILMMDTLVTLLNEPSTISDHTSQLYYLARLAPRLNPLSASTRTFEQLKNSGNFRLIRKLGTSNKIMTYYEKLPIIRLLESINETEFTEYKKMVAKIFIPLELVKMEGQFNEIKRIDYNPPLRNSGAELLQEMSVYAVYMHGTKKGLLGNCEKLRSLGKELIDFLEKEYHLE